MWLQHRLTWFHAPVMGTVCKYTAGWMCALEPEYRSTADPQLYFDHFSIWGNCFHFPASLLTCFDHLVEAVIVGGNILSNSSQSNAAAFRTKSCYEKAQAQIKPTAVTDLSENNLTLPRRTKRTLAFLRLCVCLFWAVISILLLHSFNHSVN